MKGTFVYVAGGFNEHTDNPILLLIALSRQRTNMIVDVPMYSVYRDQHIHAFSCRSRDRSKTKTDYVYIG